MEKSNNPDGQISKNYDNQLEASVDQRETSPQGRYIKLEEKLGSGAYKDVWRAYDTNDGIEVAWNVVKLSRVPPTERKRIKTEVKLLKDIAHSNVIKYFNSWVDREKEQIIFITEIMSSGSLKEYLRKNPIIRWNAVKKWCRQLLTGIEFLHKNHIIHRDIKCDNIFINGSTGDLRIGDLGLSTRIAESRISEAATSAEKREITTMTMTCLGTPEFMAPEMYEESYNEKVDIYAFGMCLLEMVTGLIPYHNCTSAAQIYRKVLGGEPPPELDIVQASNPKACDFIKLCLSKCDSRPSASELLNNPFLLPNDSEDYKEVREKLNVHVNETILEVENENEIEEEDEIHENEQLESINEEQLNTKRRSESSSTLANQKEDLALPIPKQSSEPSLSNRRISESRINNTSFSSPSQPTKYVGTSSGSAKKVRRTVVLSPRTTSNKELNPESIEIEPTNQNILRSSWDKVSPSSMELSISSHQESNMHQKPHSHSQTIPSIPSTEKEGKSQIDLRQDVTGILVQPKQLVVFDVADNPEKDFNIIFHLRLPQSRDSGHEHLEIEFEYDILHDDLDAIVEEMSQLDELTQASASKTDLLSLLTPFVSISKRIINSKYVAESSNKRNLARLIIKEVLLSDARYKNLSYRPLKKKLSSADFEEAGYVKSRGVSFDGILETDSKETGRSNPSDLPIHDLDLARVEDPNSPNSKSLELGAQTLAEKDILQSKIEKLPEYIEAIEQYHKETNRIEKEFLQKLNSLNAQKDKLQHTYEKEKIELTKRIHDLDAQLDKMQIKFKERMTEYSIKKNQILEDKLEKKKNRRREPDS